MCFFLPKHQISVPKDVWLMEDLHSEATPSPALSQLLVAKAVGFF